MKKKILVIDDMPNIVTMVKARLKASGYEVITATDGQEGLAYAHSEKPDLIILDVVMPAGGGYSVYSKLRMSSRTRSIPVIFLTAKDRPEDEATAYQLGPQYYIKKPYKPEKLLETVKKVLELKKEVPVSGSLSDIRPSIQSMTISGSGFLGNLKFSWSPSLNVLVGAKGTGKTTILETLGYALGITPYSNPTHHKEKVLYALGQGGKVEVLIEKRFPDGKSQVYQIVRGWGEDPTLSQLNPEKPIPINPFELFKPDNRVILLGSEGIETLSRNKENRLIWFDELMGEDLLQCQSELIRVMDSLKTNAEEILRIGTKLKTREDYHNRVKRIDEEIENYKKQGIEERGKESLDTKKAMLETTQTLKHILAESDQRRLDLLSTLDKSYQNLIELQNPPPPLLQEGAKVLSILQESLKVVLDDETTLFEQAIQNLTRLEMRCQERSHLSKEEKNKKENPISKENQDPFSKLKEEKASLLSSINELNGLENHLINLKKERKELFQKLKDCVENQRQIRKDWSEFLTKSLNGQIRLQVEAQGQTEVYRESFPALLKGLNLSKEKIERAIHSFGEIDSLALAETIRKGSKEIQKRFSLEPETSEALFKGLTQEESCLFKLETLIPRDSYHLEFNVDGKYLPFEKLSLSQKAMALFLLLIEKGNQILLIDQPEDFIDQTGLHEVLKKLKSKSEKNQVIIATKETALPHQCKAERVFYLEVHEGHLHIKKQPSPLTV